jgi:hypothetical protein
MVFLIIIVTYYQLIINIYLPSTSVISMVDFILPIVTSIQFHWWHNNLHVIHAAYIELYISDGWVLLHFNHTFYII